MAKARVPQPGDPDFDWSQYDSYRAGNDPLAEAQNTLRNAEQFGAENDSAQIAGIPASLAALQATADKRGGYRKFTEGLGTAGRHLGEAALATGFVGAAPLAAGLGTASSAAMVPDYLRRMVNPESTESRPGLGESAITVLPAALSLRGLRGAATAADELKAANLPESWAKLSQGRKEIPYKMFPSKPLVQDISQMEKVAKPLSEEGLTALRTTIARSTKAPGYADELGRALNSEPTPNAASTFDRMSGEGAFGPEQAAFTRKNPRMPATKVAPKVKGRDITKLGGPSLSGLRNAIISKEALAKALAEFQP